MPVDGPPQERENQRRWPNIAVERRVRVRARARRLSGQLNDQEKGLTAGHVFQLFKRLRRLRFEAVCDVGELGCRRNPHGGWIAVAQDGERGRFVELTAGYAKLQLEADSADMLVRIDLNVDWKRARPGRCLNRRCAEWAHECDPERSGRCQAGDR